LASKAPSDPYVSKKIEVRTPEEEKANPQPVPQAASPEDEELISSLYAEINSMKDKV
jgi:hypothetical protein